MSNTHTYKRTELLTKLHNVKSLNVLLKINATLHICLLDNDKHELYSTILYRE